MNNPGEQFLHQRDSKLHISQPVEHEQSRRKVSGEKTSQKPAEKIGAWMDILENTYINRGGQDPRVLDRLKAYYHNEHVIKPEDVPESHFENLQRIARERGYGDVVVPLEARKQEIEVIITDQESTLDSWFDYLTGSDTQMYPMWAKYWVWEGMLKLGVYDKAEKRFSKRTNDTVAPFPDLNREALSYVMDIVIKKARKENIKEDIQNPELLKLVQGANFGKLYAWAMEYVTPAEEHELLETRGDWIQYNQGSDHMPLVQSLQGHGTGWCTAGEETARKQLEHGDFYVYYSYDRDGLPTIPRIAIRMERQKIAEVRGIAEEQNMDPYILDTTVLDDKLQEFGEEGERYKKKVGNMKYLTEIEKKRKQNQELSEEELRFLYEFDEPILGFGYQRDPRIKEIMAERDIKKDLSFLTGFKEEEISTTSKELWSGKKKYHYGDIMITVLDKAKRRDFLLPDYVQGEVIFEQDFVHFSSEEAKRIKLPSTVMGDLNLSGFDTLGDLKFPDFVRGDLIIPNFKVFDFAKLPNFVGGYVFVSPSIDKSKLPEDIVSKYKILNSLL